VTEFTANIDVTGNTKNILILENISNNCWRVNIPLLWDNFLRPFWI
jgi:hypothetical protein